MIARDWWNLILILIAALIAQGSSLIPAEAACSTDSECVMLCPVDEIDCDGGPAPALLELGGGKVMDKSGTVRSPHRIWI